MHYNFTNQILEIMFPKRIAISSRNATILRLTQSAAELAKEMIISLKRDKYGLPGDKMNSIKALNCSAKDIVFATEFLKLNGLNLLIELINSDKYTCDTLKPVLLSFTELMGHGIILWKTVESLIIGRMIYFLMHEHTILDCVLDILDNIVHNSSNPDSIEIQLNILLDILDKSPGDEVLKQKTFTLINSIFLAATDARKVKIAVAFRTKQYRDVINSSVIKMECMSNGLKYQLYVFQSLVLSLFLKRMTPPVSENNEVAIKIRLLKRIAFQDEIVIRTDCIKSSEIRNSLGFNSDYETEQWPLVSSVGLLPLDCLEYFAQTYSTIFKTIVTEFNSTSKHYGFPLGEIAIELVRLLCNLFKIGQLPSEQNGIYYPIFFSHEHPFYELFCICIEVVHRNWIDMKASSYDFKQVLSVANEQIVRTLNSRPLSLNDFKQNIKTFTYSKIIIFHELERASREEYDSSISTIGELKRKLTPQLINIIKKQRLYYLVKGSLFYQYSKSCLRLKNKCWYARLSVNHKILHYGDCDEKTIPTVEELTNQISIASITQLIIGKECCSMMSKRRCQLLFNCSFSIEHSDQYQQPCNPVEFIASDELTQYYWVDGLSVLLNLEMRSPRKNEDLDALLSMEIKLKLLDTEGVHIDHDVPAIPPDPGDYDF